MPLSVVKGGQAANVLVQSLQTAWGLKLFGNTLIRNIGQVVYKVLNISTQIPSLFTMLESGQITVLVEIVDL